MTFRCRKADLRLATVVISTLALPLVAASGAGAAPNREMTFSNGEVVLHGTFLTPESSGSHPAVVFLHGSGPATRDGARPYAEAFAKLGIASLIFDKRGSGESGGSWTTASLDDLVGDALAAVDWVRQQPGIDPGRVGLWAISQSGWIAPRAAAESADVGFLVVISGGGATPRESDLYTDREGMRQLGWDATRQAKANEILDTYFDYLATGRDRAKLADRLATLAGTPLEPLEKLLEPVLPSDENRKNWAWVATYDPAADLARVHVPVLLMFGDLDQDHPTSVAVEKWREGLRAAANTSATIMIFPGAGHGIRMRKGFAGPGRAPFADGYEESMLGWLWLHVVAQDPRP
jgi:pimeloyl-ACP methyl ester carboxylesterase